MYRIGTEGNSGLINAGHHSDGYCQNRQVQVPWLTDKLVTYDG